MTKPTIKKIFQDYWESFLSTSPNVRQVVIDEVEKMMDCGDCSKGYALYWCDHCHRFKYVPFRCKSRFCNTCGATYQMDRASSISSKLLNCRHRHVVFTIPEELRIFFLKDRALLDILFKSASHTLLSWFSQINKSENFIPGIVCAIHTFGRDLKWNPHIHMLITEGASGNSKVWKNVSFFPYQMLRKRWQTTLLFNLEKALSKDSFRKIKNTLYHSNPYGFYVYGPSSEFNSPIAVSNYITRYIGRPAMAMSRITSYDGEFVTFWYERHEDNKKIEVTLSAIEFIKKLIVHIPNKYFNQLRYYGLYAKAPIHKEKLIYMLSRAKVAAKRLTKSWVFRFEATFGKDPTKCSCGNYMEFIDIFLPGSIAFMPP